MGTGHEQTIQYDVYNANQPSENINKLIISNIRHDVKCLKINTNRVLGSDCELLLLYNETNVIQK